MGNACCGHADAAFSKGIPVCLYCQKTSGKLWKEMNEQEQRFWDWKGDDAICRKCFIQNRIKERQQQEEKQWLKQAKEELFPKTKAADEQLKKIESGEHWEGTSSFMEPYKPSSKVEDMAKKLADWEAAENVRLEPDGPARSNLQRSTSDSAQNGHHRPLSSVQEDDSAMESPKSGSETHVTRSSA